MLSARVSPGRRAVGSRVTQDTRPDYRGCRARLRHRAFATFTITGDGPRLARMALVLSGVETVLAFVLILGVLLRPLVLVDKHT